MAGDWVQYYKSAMTPTKAMSGKSKGRTLFAMPQRATKLMGTSTTRQSGCELKEYYNDLKIFHEFRGGKVEPGMASDELKQRCAVVLKHIRALPAALAQRWLAQATCVSRAGRGWVKTWRP